MGGQDDIRIGVLGLGHVGLPTALAFSEMGWPVVGADHDGEKVRRIASGESPFYEPGLGEVLRRHLAGGRFRVTDDVGAAVREANVLFICVGTPQHPDGSPDLSQVEAVVRQVARNLNGYKVIVEKSTVPVQTAHWLQVTLRRYRTGNHEFDVASNPEFLREGTALRDCLYPDRIVIGVDSPRAREVLLRIYWPWVERGLPPDRLVVTDLQTAELIKHATNAFLALRISYINLIADLCEATGADVVEVARGMGLDPASAPTICRRGSASGDTACPRTCAPSSGWPRSTGWTSPCSGRWRGSTRPASSVS
jgi:UDPglucose 6-dehydrogenase